MQPSHLHCIAVNAHLASFPPQVIGFLLFSAFLAGLARGFSGFGAALIFVPLASSVIGPKLAVPLLLVVDGVMTLGLIPGAWHIADRRNVFTMAVGAVVGVPFGAYLLTQLDPETIRWGIVVLVLVLLALLMSGWRYDGRPKTMLTVLVGLTSGLFSGAAQVGGPPVVAYWLGGAIPGNVVRANIILYFAISTTLSAASYIWNGLITAEILVVTLAVAPLYGLGLWLGIHMFGLASDKTFRWLCYVLIALAALASLPILDGVLR
jgi:uncharacterized membrane protein YfcA